MGVKVGTKNAPRQQIQIEDMALDSTEINKVPHKIKLNVKHTEFPAPHSFLSW